MNRIIFSCVLLVFLSDQVMSDSPLGSAENHGMNDLESWKQNASKIVNDTFECLNTHYREVSEVEYHERFGDVKFYELRKCEEGRNIIDASEKNIATSIKKCNVQLASELQKKLAAATKVDPNYISSSRDAMDQCLKNFWDEKRPEMFKVTEILLPCVQKKRMPIKPTAEETSKLKSDPSYIHYCIIKDGILLDNHSG